MPTDPAQGFPRTPDQRTADRLAAIERELGELRRAAVVQVGAGAPSVPAANLRNGTPYIDQTANRLYYVVNGAWRYVALT